MAVTFYDRVWDQTSTTGTGTLTLTSTAPTGYRTFASTVANAATVRYVVATQDRTAWEVREGVFTLSGTTLTRGTLLASSTGSAVSFASGTKDVWIDCPANTLTNLAAALSFSGLVGANGGVLSAITITGTSNEITVTNGDGVSGNPTLSIPSTFDIGGKTWFRVPVASSPDVTVSGRLAYNSTTNKLRVGISNAAQNVATESYVSGVITLSNLAEVGTITSGVWNGTTIAVANGGTGSTTASGARTNLGATTVGANIFTLGNPSAIRFLKINADNTVTARSAANFAVDIGLGVTGLVKADGSGGFTAAVENSDYQKGIAYILVRDEKAQNTGGGTFTSGAWQTRTINTEVVDTGANCVISSNQITLAAGTYECHITCPGYAVDRHQARLQNITDGTTTLLGTSERSWSSDGTPTRSVIIGRFTIATGKTFEIQHRCETTFSTNGFGLAANFATEVYTVAEFRKVA